MRTPVSGDTSEEVAEVILTAVSDGTGRLHPVATEGMRSEAAMHREASEEASIAVMRREVGLALAPLRHRAHHLVAECLHQAPQRLDARRVRDGVLIMTTVP